MRYAVAFAILLCAATLARQTAPGVYRVGGDVTAPILLEKQEPGYSEEARAAKLQGSVLLYVVVGEDGRAHNIRVVKSLGLGLDENAVASVGNWRFQPGAKGDQPVAVEATVEVN